MTTLFKLHDERGIPLGVALMVAKKLRFAVDVPRFYADARAAGWTEAKALATIREALANIGEPKGYIDTVEAWLTLPEFKSSRAAHVRDFAGAPRL